MIVAGNNTAEIIIKEAAKIEEITRAESLEDALMEDLKVAKIEVVVTSIAAQRFSMGKRDNPPS